MSIMTNFIFNFNTFMGLKNNAFRVIKEKTHFWADILDFEPDPVGKVLGSGNF